jgi:hypothetical protein
VYLALMGLISINTHSREFFLSVNYSLLSYWPGLVRTVSSPRDHSLEGLSLQARHTVS